MSVLHCLSVNVIKNLMYLRVAMDGQTASSRKQDSQIYGLKIKGSQPKLNV